MIKNIQIILIEILISDQMVILLAVEAQSLACPTPVKNQDVCSLSQ